MVDDTISIRAGQTEATQRYATPGKQVYQPSGFNLRKQGMVLTGLLGAFYLLSGSYADTICSLLTSVPVAVFTYQVLMNPNTTKAGYHSVLFYWSLHGLLAAVDTVFHDSYGYYVGKSILLAAVFGNAAHANKAIFTKLTGIGEEKLKALSTILSPYDSEGFPMCSPSPTICEDGSSIFMDEFYNETDVTALPITSPNPDRSPSQSDFELCFDSDVEDYSYEQGGYTHGINRALTPHPAGVESEFALDSYEQPPSAMKVKSSLLNMTRCTAGVEYAYGDIITNPMDMITFKSPHEAKSITVVNLSTENIMWALKSNALHRLGASPACGVILSGGKMNISVVLHETGAINSNGDSIDKMAIDYVLVGGEQEFNGGFVNREDKKRHLMHISYDF